MTADDMKIELGFGDGVQTVSLPSENVLGILAPKASSPGLTGTEEVRRALQAPIESKPLHQLVRPGMRIAIVTSDITRPCPSHQILPAILEELSAAGVSDADITVIFALGSHRPQTDAEQRKLVGDAIYTRVRCIDSDPNDCLHLGITSRGTPVDITRTVAEADFRILLGNIEYHYFAGYSGGAKAIMPGVSTRAAIQANHSMMLHPNACAGVLAGNPLREDIEEAAAMCGVDFLVNVVLDAHKQIIRAVAGNAVAAHRVGCAFLDTLYRVEIPALADIVIASQGGAPKDLNLYQTQKALDNAIHAVKPGGIVILMGSCREGFGEATFEDWMLRATRPADLMQWVQEHFQLGGHKAAAIAMALQTADIYLVSDLSPELVHRIFLRPFAHVQAAVQAALAQKGPHASVLVMPYGGSTLPQYCPAT
jgi:nickel-dependent lactate racemase